MRSNESSGHSPLLRAVYDDAVELLNKPVSVQNARRGRVAAGVFAVAGSAAIFFSWGNAAEAKTATNAASAPAKGAGAQYTIRKGDTLGSIAADHGMTAKALANANGLSNSVIIAGNTLTIPNGSSNGKTTGGYIIKKGDSLSSIGARYGVTPATLATANNISTKKLLTVGQSLVVPSGGASTAAAKPGKPAVAPKAATKGLVPTDLPNTDARFKLKPQFQKAASQYGIPLSLLQAVTWNESGWQNHVVSNVGARGIGQIMPETGKHIDELAGRHLDSNNPADNIAMSAIYLKYLIGQTNGDYKLALAAYYQGLASVRERGQYDDTKKYVSTILALQKNYF